MKNIELNAPLPMSLHLPLPPFAKKLKLQQKDIFKSNVISDSKIVTCLRGIKFGVIFGLFEIVSICVNCQLFGAGNRKPAKHTIISMVLPRFLEISSRFGRKVVCFLGGFFFFLFFCISQIFRSKMTLCN